tara:strand:+ start:805 stop:1005 length:201 start_codon:yes stop_codon:yes gene_type:complete
MIEAVFMFCWLHINDGMWAYRDCEQIAYAMHRTYSVRDCRDFLAHKIEEVKGDGGKAQLALCVVTI